MREFKDEIKDLEKKVKGLISMKPIKTKDCPKTKDGGGVYLFSEGDKHLYAGRTKRQIRERLQIHSRPSVKDAPFAWHLAREKTGKTTKSYQSKDSRKTLLKDSEFNQALLDAKKRIKEMDVRFVEESDPTRQALLEIYVAYETQARYNDFDTH